MTETMETEDLGTVLETITILQEKMIECAECEQAMTELFFSKTQWRKGNKGKCIDCIRHAARMKSVRAAQESKGKQHSPHDAQEEEDPMDTADEQDSERQQQDEQASSNRESDEVESDAQEEQDPMDTAEVQDLDRQQQDEQASSNSESDEVETLITTLTRIRVKLKVPETADFQSYPMKWKTEMIPKSLDLFLTYARQQTEEDIEITPWKGEVEPETTRYGPTDLQKITKTAELLEICPTIIVNTRDTNVKVKQVTVDLRIEHIIAWEKLRDIIMQTGVPVEALGLQCEKTKELAWFLYSTPVDNLPTLKARLEKLTGEKIQLTWKTIMPPLYDRYERKPWTDAERNNRAVHIATDEKVADRVYVKLLKEYGRHQTNFPGEVKYRIIPTIQNAPQAMSMKQRLATMADKQMVYNNSVTIHPLEEFISENALTRVIPEWNNQSAQTIMRKMKSTTKTKSGAPFPMFQKVDNHKPWQRERPTTPSVAIASINKEEAMQRAADLITFLEWYLPKVTGSDKCLDRFSEVFTQSARAKSHGNWWDEKTNTAVKASEVEIDAYDEMDEEFQFATDVQVLDIPQELQGTGQPAVREEVFGYGDGDSVSLGTAAAIKKTEAAAKEGKTKARVSILRTGTPKEDKMEVEEEDKAKKGPRRKRGRLADDENDRDETTKPTQRAEEQEQRQTMNRSGKEARNGKASLNVSSSEARAS